MRAIQLQPDFPQAHNNLGLIITTAASRQGAGYSAEFVNWIPPTATPFRIWLIRSRWVKKKWQPKNCGLTGTNREARPKDDWELQVGRFWRAIQRKHSSQSRGRRKENCRAQSQAYFFAGTKRLIEGDKSAAGGIFSGCLWQQAQDIARIR